MTHADIIDLWESPKILAQDTYQLYNTVMQWRVRCNIPSKHWTMVVKSAQKHDLAVTFKILAEQRGK